jgi:hypothetical protein
MERGQELLAAAEAGLQATGVTAETGIQTLSAQAQATLQTSAALAETGIQTTGATAQAGIQAVEAAAIAAIQAASAGGSAAESAGGFMGGIMGQVIGAFSSTGSGVPDLSGATFSMGGSFAPVPFLPAAHEGGLIGPTFPKLHNGGEVPIMAQTGEFVIRKWSADRLGPKLLDNINKSGEIPIPAVAQAATRNQRGEVYNNSFNFNGVQDMDSFRRSRAQLTADLSRAVRRGNKML